MDLVPESLRKYIATRRGLADFESELRWVKAQMEYHRGAVQAHHTSRPEKALHLIDYEQPEVHLRQAIQSFQEAVDQS